MHVVLSTEKEAFSKHFESIESWQIGLIPWDVRNDPLYSDYFDLNYMIWLGSSDDNSTWAISAISIFKDDDEPLTTEMLYANCSAILIDPPSVREDSILMILFRVYNEIRKNGDISRQATEEILSSVPFAVYQPAGTFLPELPSDWHHLPAELCVSFTLCEGGCLYPEIWKDHHHNTLKGALEELCVTRLNWVLIHYSILIREVTPFLSWDVEWPLSRRIDYPPHRREKQQGDLPWQYEANQSVLSIYQNVPWLNRWSMGPPAYQKPSIWLRVAGRSPDEAIANWHQCAKALRKIRPKKMKDPALLNIERTG